MAKEAKDELETSQNHYEDNLQKINNYGDAVLKAYSDQKIDPNNYYNSKSTPGKISTAIGLILGGLGGALTGQENPALKFMNEQIDRDIEAQKMDLGRKKSLYEFNLQRLGNAQAAQNMTRINLLDKAALDFKKAEGTASGPVVKARAAQAASLVKQQVDQLKAQQAQRQAVMGMAAQPGGDPSKLVPFLVPKERQAEVYKEIKKAQDMQQDAPLLMNLFDRASKDVGVTSALIEPESKQALRNAYLKHLKDDVGRINETELATANNTFPQGLDRLSPERAANRRADFEANLQRGMAAPTAKSFGIDLSQAARPQAAPAPIRHMEGIPYRRGAAGNYHKVK